MPEWHKERETRNDAEAEIVKLKKEKLKKESVKNPEKITEIEGKIKDQETARDAADARMMEIEKKYNDEDIVKYLQSTGLNRDMARDDFTSWCSSFTNWCVEQTKYQGTRDALANSWLTWGEEIKEPRYGAITVVTRGVGQYHVGFFLHIGEKSVPDGEEELEVNGKDGKPVKKKIKKSKLVEHVHLLSGNFSRQIKEGNEWTVNSADSSIHLVSYRWPTMKELKK